MPLPQINIGNGMLGDAAVYSVEVVQELNQHWWCTVVCRQSAEAPVPVDQLIGQPIEIRTSDAAGQSYLHFSGFVQDVELRLEVWGNSAAVLRCVSESLRMDVAAHHQYYLAATLTSVASTIAGRTGLAIEVKTPASKPLNYAQFGETDFSFLARVVDDYGGWFRPTPDGLEIQNAFQPGGKLVWLDMEGLLHFQIAAELVAPSVSGSHYDHHVAKSQRFTAVSKQPACFSGAAQFVGSVETASQKVPPAFEPNRARAMTLEDYRQQLEGESERLLGSAVLGRGTSRAQALEAGNTVEITGLAGAQGIYGLVQVTHRWSREGYSNTFRCTPWKQYRHRRPPEVQQWTGLVSARVVAHDDPKKMGRLQVRYAWQGEGETHWARMVSSHAGHDRGSMMMPEVGDEVAVLFEDGDPERPLIVGSLWNGVHQQQRGGFFTPTSDIADNNIKRLITKSGNRMQFVDTPGQETILFATPHNANITLTEKSTASGVPMISLSSEGDIVLSAPNGRVHINSKFFSREVGIPQADAPPAPFQCGSAWGDILAQTNAIANMSDVMKRNRIISSQYADMYKNKRPGPDRPTDLKWAGLGAIVSTQAGCGMQHARNVQKGAAIAGPVGGILISPIVGPVAGPVIGVGGAAGAIAAAEVGRRALADANQLIFRTVSPAMRFVQKYGAKQLQQCMQSGSIGVADHLGGQYAGVANNKVDNTVIHPQLARAIEDMTKGTARDDRFGADKIAGYEQKTVVQNRIYSNPVNKVVFQGDQKASQYSAAKIVGAQSPEISLSSDCERNHLIKFDGDITKSGDRIDYYGKVMDKYSDQSPEQINKVNDEILNK